MIERICAHIHNYFTRRDGQPLDRAQGDFTISGGALTVDFLKPGNHFLIQGSDFNDGVHVYPADDLVDETFTGAIYKMAPPRAFLALAADISAWQQKYADVLNSPYQSEDVIGVYSYSKLTMSKTNTSGGAMTWEIMFANRLNQWRKLSLWL